MIVHSLHQRFSRRGFTILELAISVAVFSLVALVVGQVSNTGAGVFEVTNARTELEKRAQRVIDRVSEEVSRTGVGFFFPDPGQDVGSSQLSFQTVSGLDGTDAVWGPAQIIAFEYEEGEIDNDLDDNGNGLVDEGVVVLTREVGTPDETRVVLCHGVSELLEGETSNGLDDNDNLLRDEEGLSFQRIGEVMTIYLTVELIDSNDVLIRRTLETSVRMRN